MKTLWLISLVVVLLVSFIVISCDPVASADADSDGVPDSTDNCPSIPNQDQMDSDADDVGDVCDNCPDTYNPEQVDLDDDGYGVLCDCDDDDSDVYPGTPCDDENVCTTNDTCSGGTCGGTPVDCGDGNPCTDDGCNPSTGCYHNNNTSPCDDGDACTTNDTCSGGTCGGTPVDCDDGNPCTVDICDEFSGCQNLLVAEGTPCEDGDACTTEDTCSGGVCVGGPPVDCDDGNPCTDDGCNPSTGCYHNNNTSPCDDGDVCTDSDTCSGGVCVGGSCADGTLCDDGDPNTVEDTCWDCACVGTPVE